MWNISLSFYICNCSLLLDQRLYLKRRLRPVWQTDSISLCKSGYALLLFNPFYRPFRHIVIHSCENMKPSQIQPGKKHAQNKKNKKINTTIVFLGRHNIYTVTLDADRREVLFQPQRRQKLEPWNLCFIDPTPCYLCMRNNYTQPLMGEGIKQEKRGREHLSQRDKHDKTY